jgi:hypothetical protein
LLPPDHPVGVILGPLVGDQNGRFRLL